MGVTLQNMKLYFDVGTPIGHKEIIDSASFTLEPRITAVSTNKGSVGGSIIVANIEGVGPFENDANADYKNKITLLSNASNQNICSKVFIREYGKLECLTNSGAI
jgi:hypothetical protein